MPKPAAGGAGMMTLPTDAQVRRQLRAVRLIASLDLALLLALVVASLVGQRALVRVLGPVHGVNFLFLLTVAATAALDGMWGWWFPAAIFLTGGPLGALIGERAVARRRAATHALASEAGAEHEERAGAIAP